MNYMYVSMSGSGTLPLTTTTPFTKLHRLGWGFCDESKSNLSKPQACIQIPTFGSNSLFTAMPLSSFGGSSCPWLPLSLAPPLHPICRDSCRRAACSLKMIS